MFHGLVYTVFLFKKKKKKAKTFSFKTEQPKLHVMG